MTREELKQWHDSLPVELQKKVDEFAQYHYELGINRGYERGRPRDVLDMD